MLPGQELELRLIGAGAPLPPPVLMLEYRAVLVFGPTSPSTERPADAWKDFTAVSVRGPNWPSTSRCWPLPLSRACSVATQPPLCPSTMFAGQDAERRSRAVEGDSSVSYSSRLVFGPTWPSTESPCVDWKLRTALSVAGPKSPSTSTE